MRPLTAGNWSYGNACTVHDLRNYHQVIFLTARVTRRACYGDSNASQLLQSLSSWCLKLTKTKSRALQSSGHNLVRIYRREGIQHIPALLHVHYLAEYQCYTLQRNMQGNS
jgi:hypothetical protein